MELNNDTKSLTRTRVCPTNPVLVEGGNNPFCDLGSDEYGEYKCFACDNNAIICTLHTLKLPNTSHTFNTPFNLSVLSNPNGPNNHDELFVDIPPGCTLEFGNDGGFKNGTLISHGTKFVNFPSYSDPTEKAAIVGKIYNVQGQEITVKGDVINRSTPVIFYHSIRGCDYYKSPYILDSNVIRTNNAGLNECLMHLSVFGTNSNDAYVTGGWRSTDEGQANTPAHAAMEAYVNGLTVRGIKFHSNNWKGSVADYCNFVYFYTDILIREFQRLGLTAFTEVYIVNERGDWTSRYSRHVSEIRDLAIDIAAELGKVARISFAGLNQLLKADPQLYDVIQPGLNTYPALSYLDGYLDNVMTGSGELGLSIKQRIEQQFDAIVREQFTHNSHFWNSNNNKVYNLALSEIGVKPYIKALRAPEYYNIHNESPRDNIVMTSFWEAIKRVAQQLNLEYIDFFYSHEVNNDLEDDIHDILIDF